MSTEPFDAPDRLNDDGTVTMVLAPSTWHAFNMSPDTYQTFTSDHFEESEIEGWSEHLGRDLNYDDFDWTYDHAGIVRSISEVMADWIGERLSDLGVGSAQVELTRTGSPKFYNFESDWFEIEVTLDPAELRAVTPDFDVDAWASEYYRSYDGFHSYVTGRMHDDDYHAEYDFAFRVESLLRENADTYEPDNWKYEVWENEYEIYMDHVTMTLRDEEDYEGSGYKLSELHEWSETYNAPRQTETLPLGETA